MNNLISKESIIELIYHNQAPITEHDLDNLPIIDAEKVIRCIACEHFEPSEEESWGWCRNNRCKKSKNGFCDEAMHKVN